MFVLSVEGPSFIDKGLWSTHKVLAVCASEEVARQMVANDPVLADENANDVVVLLTDMATGKATRLK